MIEVVIKMLGLGILNYLRDGWNQFDFLLVTLTFATDFALASVLKNAKGVKASRTAKTLKLTKTQKALRGFKITRSLRSMRFYRWFKENLKSVSRIKNMFSTIMLSLPASKIQ